MPWGWECRAKLIKQVTPKPVDKRGKEALPTPGPGEYEPPKLFCGPGFDRIKKAPAYSFGLNTKLITKSVLTKNARLFNIQRMVHKGGPTRITHSVVTPHIEPVFEGTKTPGPAVYKPPPDSRVKRPPAYTMQHAKKPPYEPFDMWTPPPNMYRPPVMAKAEPAYSLGYPVRPQKPQQIPGPGEHEPNYNYVKKTKPAYSFGAPFRNLKPMKSPAPNTYCQKKLKNSVIINKVIRGGAREIIYKVFMRCMAKYQAGNLLTELDDVYKRTADSTGVSESTVRRIVNHGIEH